MARNKWPLAIAAGAFTSALFGGVALASFQPFTGTEAATVGGPTATAADRLGPKTKLKAVLDALVLKNTITQAQEDAILRAVKEAEGASKPKVAHPSVGSPLGDLALAASDYLDMDQKSLLAQMRSGKSLADIADGLSAQGKSTRGLVDALTTVSSAKLDQAVAANTLTPDRAAALRAKLPAEIATFVNRSFTKPMLNRSHR
jgi:hypothetical protein